MSQYAQGWGHFDAKRRLRARRLALWLIASGVGMGIAIGWIVRMV